jgi:hypothetical protein
MPRYSYFGHQHDSHDFGKRPGILTKVGINGLLAFVGH